MKYAIEVSNLKKSYGKFQAVKGVSFKIKKGEIFGLLGPNGAGKTTIINILSDLLTKDSGRVKILGKEIKDVKELTNTATAYSWMTGIIKTRENLKVFAKLYNVPNPEERIDYLMNLLGIMKLRNKKTYSLSSGETTRLNIAKGLINKPEVLLLDECTVGLDPVVARKTRKVLKDLQKKEKTTILFTTHLMQEAEELCDRIAFISHGKIIKVGTPATLKKLINKQIIRIDFMPTNINIEKFLKKQGFDVLYVKNNRAAIGVKHASEQLHKVIHPILKAGFKIKDLHIRKPTLEDVFVKITGEVL